MGYHADSDIERRREDQTCVSRQIRGDTVSERLLNSIKAERKRMGLTQAALAEKVGVSRKTVNTVENGVFTPSTLLALKLAKALDRSVNQVFWLDHSSLLLDA